MTATRLTLLLLALGIGQSAWAAEQAAAHVTILQSTYLPDNIQFQVDAGTTSCPAGHWLTWSSHNTDNNKLTYSTLLAAITNGKQIIYGVNPGDTTCTVIYLDILVS